jgi:hypothetical protein
MEYVGILYGRLVYLWLVGIFMLIRYILCLLGTFFPVLVCCTKKTLATMLRLAFVTSQWRIDPPRLMARDEMPHLNSNFNSNFVQQFRRKSSGQIMAKLVFQRISF